METVPEIGGRVALKEYGADDDATCAAAYSVVRAGREHDSPWMAPLTPYRWQMHLQHGWDGSPVRHYVALSDGAPIGAAELALGEWDNRDIGWLDLFVIRPEHRRRGHGSALLAQLVEEARAAGCTSLGASGWDTEEVRRFAAAHGFARGSQDVYRVVRPREVPPAVVSTALGETAPYARDYELVRLPGRAPEELLEPLAELVSAINDAPLDDLELEDEVFTAERVRRYEESVLSSGRRLYRLLARHRTTGALAGHTVVVVDTDAPEQAHQHDTAVARGHRGHRLGLLLKAEMMRWLAESEPQVQTLDTWNAETNAHMIAVNDRLGYVPLGRELQFQRRV